MDKKNGKTALLTGASKGYGRAVSRVLLENGWRVIGNARTADVLQETEAELAGLGEFLPVVGDVDDERHLAELVGLAADHGDLSLVVNNAGALGPSPRPELVDFPVDDLAALLQTNVLRPLRLIQLALPRMVREGAVINITSDASVGAYEGWGGYGASKAALDSISAVLGKELESVRVYALDPGDMRTDMHQEAFPGEDISDRALPEVTAPAVLRLVEERPESGRYRAEDLLAPVA